MRKYIILSLVFVFSSCSFKKLVKKADTPIIDNTDVQVIVPFAKPTKTLPDIKGQAVSDLPMYESTNTIAILLGTTVVVLCFLPLILLYIHLAYIYLKDLYRKYNNRTK